MNPVALYFASGDSLYAGAILLLVAIAISPYLRRALPLRLRNTAAWVAMAMMVMACPPFPWIVDAVFFAGFALWFAGSNYASAGRTSWKLRPATTVPLLILLVVLSATEFSHRSMPAIVGPVSDHLVVIGDSISAGMDANAPTWPLLMQRMTGVPVENLARAGAQVTDALTMAQKITPEDRVVLIEIGGNDLLSGVPTKEFGQALEAVFAKLAMPGRIVVMFELPLLPHKIGYGQTQRRLAARYNVSLIPKRCLTNVLGEANATTDGLHLSPVGARRMAALVASVFSPVLKPPS
jgi:acyl-CoA thioesterase-1